MNTFIYCIRDCKAEYCHPPFTQRTNAEAIRTFADMCRNNETSLGQHPEDFTLLRVGSFDVYTGVIKGEDQIVLANGGDFKKDENNGQN